MELQNLVWNLCPRDKGYLRWQWFMVPIFYLLKVSPTSDFSHFLNELNMQFCFLIFVGFCNYMFFAATNTLDDEECWLINLYRHILVLELIIRKIRCVSMPNFIIRLSMQLNFLERYFIWCLQIQIFDFVAMYCLLITFHHLAV